MWKRGGAHLESDTRDSTKDVIVIQYFLRNGFGVADEQRAGGPAHGVELRPGRRRPATFLADLRESVGVPWIKVVGSLLVGVGQKADGVKSHGYLLAGHTPPAPPPP